MWLIIGAMVVFAALAVIWFGGSGDARAPRWAEIALGVGCVLMTGYWARQLLRRLRGA